MSEMFERASELKLRFDSTRGKLSVEDLWDLPLTSRTNEPNLDDIARGLDRKVRALNEEVSFVKPVEQKNDELELRFAVVKHIIAVLIARRDAAAEASSRASRKQELLALLNKKDKEAESSLTREEILAKIAEM